MTTDQKMRYIESFRKLLSLADNHDSAISHANFLRGLLAAWNADLSITVEQYRSIHEDIEVIMEVKRKLPRFEGVGF